MLLSARRPVKPLPDKEIRELARKYRDTGDTTALHQMVESNLRLANTIARSFTHQNVPFEDLFQEAVMGLMHGCSRYNPELPYRISTYVHWWCRAYVGRYFIRNSGAVHWGAYAIDRRVMKAIREASRLPEPLSAQELADVVGTTVQNVQLVQARMGGHDQSLSRPLGPDGDRTLEDVIPDGKPPLDELAANAEILARATALINKMPKREALVARRRLLSHDDVTLQQVGDELGVSRERVRQIEAKVLARLRAALHVKKAA